MFALLIVVHIIVCIVLIATILLQAGKGGGLTEAFGGGSVQSVLGTQAPGVLKKATEISAIVFIITCLLLGIVTARRGRSLFEGGRLPVLPISPQQASAPMAVPIEPSQASTAGQEEVTSVQTEAESVTAPEMPVAASETVPVPAQEEQ
ncbi:MAG: preprotein translocase subunit SecG [Candidatus Omnitrophota bacterium]